jgi:hypothetical protein
MLQRLAQKACFSLSYVLLPSGQLYQEDYLTILIRKVLIRKLSYKPSMSKWKYTEVKYEALSQYRSSSSNTTR